MKLSKNELKGLIEECRTELTTEGTSLNKDLQRFENEVSDTYSAQEFVDSGDGSVNVIELSKFEELLTVLKTVVITEESNEEPEEELLTTTDKRTGKRAVFQKGSYQFVYNELYPDELVGIVARGKHVQNVHFGNVTSWRWAIHWNENLIGQRLNGLSNKDLRGESVVGNFERRRIQHDELVKIVKATENFTLTEGE